MSARSMVRRKMRRAFLVSILVATLMVAFLPGTAAQGEGWGVARFVQTFDEMLGGQTQKGWFTLTSSRSDPVALDVLTMNAPKDPDDPSHDWGDAATWVTLDTGDDVTIPPNGELRYDFTIRVPQIAANGEYRAQVRFQERDDNSTTEQGGAGATVVTSQSASLTMIVGGQPTERVESNQEPDIRDAEEGTLWIVRVHLENTGNVEANPHVLVQIWDQYQEQVLTEVWFNTTRLQPGESGLYSFSIQNLELPQGQYLVRTIVYLDEQMVRTSGFHAFQVLEEGALKRSAEFQTIRIGDGRQVVAEAGDLVRLTAVWANNGQALVEGHFEGTVTLNGKLVDTLESDPLAIDIEETGEIEMFYTVEEAGDYVFAGRIHYGSFVTLEKSALLQVQGSGLDLTGPVGIAIGFLLLAGIAAAIIVMVRKRRLAGAATASKRPRPAHRRPPLPSPQQKQRSKVPPRQGSSQPPPGGRGAPPTRSPPPGGRPHRGPKRPPN